MVYVKLGFNDMHKRNLLIPTEIFKREYPGRALLLASAIRLGLRVVVGSKTEIKRYISENKLSGIFHYKGAGVKNTALAGLLEKFNCAVTAQYEETSFVLDNFESWYRLNPHLHEARNINRFFTWGADEQSGLVRQFTKRGLHAEHIVRSGSPRAALWGDLGRLFFESEIKQLRCDNGDYVLFATNFAAGNAIGGVDGLLQLNKKLKSFSEHRLNAIRDQIEGDRTNMQCFVRAIDDVISRTKYNVVIRPHPVEDFRFWEKRFGGNKRVQIVNDGPVTPWILAAKCLIHIGCTTGVEAASCDTPSIALIGCDSTDVLTHFPNTVSIVERNPLNLADLIVEIEEEYSSFKDSSGLINKLEARIDSRGRSESADIIASHMGQIDVPATPLYNPSRSSLILSSGRKILRTFDSGWRRKLIEAKNKESEQLMLRDYIQRAMAVSGDAIDIKHTYWSPSLQAVESVCG